MSTEIIRPNSDINSLWTPSPLYSKINDAVTQPSAGNDVTCGGSDSDINSVEQIFGFPTPSSTGICTQVKIWIYWKAEGDDLGVGVRAKINGSWTSYQYTADAIGGTGYTWDSVTFSTSTLMSSLGLQIGMQPAETMVHGDEFDVDVVYAELTYTPTGGDDAYIKLLQRRKASFFNVLDDE